MGVDKVTAGAGQVAPEVPQVAEGLITRRVASKYVRFEMRR